VRGGGGRGVAPRPALEHAARITAPVFRVTAPPPGTHGHAPPVGHGYGFGYGGGYGHPYVLPVHPAAPHPGYAPGWHGSYGPGDT
ncbi:hypothetical protein ACFW8Z_27885, partial [Streptomyces sp. NPDC059515]